MDDFGSFDKFISWKYRYNITCSNIDRIYDDYYLQLNSFNLE